MFEQVGTPAISTARAKSLRARMNLPEQRLWKELRKLDCNFRRQAPIGRYITDFASHGRRLVIEVDGGVHERLAEVAARDVERRRWIESQGYTLMRFPSHRVISDVHGCIAEIEALLLDGGGLGGGVPAEVKGNTQVDSGVQQRPSPNTLRSPPSPTLPPSRRKGEN